MDKLNISPNLAISDNGFLFLSTTGETFTVNEIAKTILKEIKNGNDYKSIFKRLLNEYDIDEKTLEKDLADFINQLNIYNLIENY